MILYNCSYPTRGQLRNWKPFYCISHSVLIQFIQITFSFRYFYCIVKSNYTGSIFSFLFCIKICLKACICVSGMLICVCTHLYTVFYLLKCYLNWPCYQSGPQAASISSKSNAGIFTLFDFKINLPYCISIRKTILLHSSFLIKTSVAF